MGRVLIFLRLLCQTPGPFASSYSVIQRVAMMLRRVSQKHGSVLDEPQNEDHRVAEKGCPQERICLYPLDQEVATMAHENVTDEGLAELIRRTAEAASALIRGDIRTYLTLIPHADDYQILVKRNRI